MPIPREPLKPVSRQPLRQRVYDAMLDAIVRGELTPGEVLVDAELTARFGTSRTPVREAINRLAAIGLVEVSPRRRTRVAPLDVARAAQSRDTLTALQLRAMEGSVERLTDADKTFLRGYRAAVLANVPTMREYLASGRLEAELYDVFFARYGNTSFQRVMAALAPSIRRHMAALAHRIDLESLREHRIAVLDAALAGDTAATVEGLRSYAASTVLPSDGTVVRREGSPLGIVESGPRLGEIATSQLRAAIVDGTLLPGEGLPEAELVAWLGVSRTPLRVALNELEIEGLIDFTPGGRTRVATLGIERVAETMETLTVLHRWAVDKAMPTLNEATLDRLRTEMLAMEAAEQRGDLSETVAAMLRYSRILDEASGNAMLLNVTDRARPRAQQFFVVGQELALATEARRAFVEAHRALERRDGAAAMAALDTLPGAHGTVEPVRSLAE